MTARRSSRTLRPAPRPRSRSNDPNTETLTYAGTIEDVSTGGTVGLTLAGTGGATLVLSGTNTYSDDTTLSSGTLEIVAASASSPNSDLLVEGGALDTDGVDMVYQNPNDGSVYVLLGNGVIPLGGGGEGNTVAVTQDPSTGDIDVTANSHAYPPFSPGSSVFVYSPGTSTITIAPTIAASVSVCAGSGSTVTGPTDNLPEVSIFADTPTASEASGSDGDFTLYRSGDTSQQLTVNYTLFGSSAAEGTDYTLQGDATFAAGNDTATIAVVPIDEGFAGGSKTVVFAINRSDDYTIDTDNPSATVTIDDNDLPKVTISPPTSETNESGGQTVNVTVSCNGMADQPLVVNYSMGGSAVNGQDYQMLSGDVVIPAGSSSATIAIVPLDAGVVGGSRSVNLALAAGIGYTVSDPPPAATVTIEDNDGTNPGPASWSPDTCDSEGTNSGGFVRGEFALCLYRRSDVLHHGRLHPGRRL